MAIVNQSGVVLDEFYNEYRDEEGQIQLYTKKSDYSKSTEIYNSELDFSVFFDEYKNFYVVAYGDEQIPLDAENILEAYDEALETINL